MTIAEQLAGAAVTDSLKYASTAAAEAAGWKKMAWGLSISTFGAAGWTPPGYSKHEPDGTNGGTWLSGKKVKGSSLAILKSATFGVSQAGGAPEFRQRSVWLFTTGEGTANGYQLTAKDTAVGTSTKYTLRLAKYVAGAQTLLGSEVEVELESTGAIAVVAAGGKVSMWAKKNEAAVWTLVGSEVSDATFTEGFAGVDGNGSNPTMSNFTGAEFAAEQPPIAENSATAPLPLPSSGDRLAPRLAATITTGDGQSYVVGPDEDDPERVAVSIDFNTELNGGFGPATITMALPPGSPQPDGWLLAGVRVYDADTDAGYYEGRVTNISSSDGKVQLQTEGWAKHLADDETAMEIFIDRDLGGWGEPSLAEQQRLLAAALYPLATLQTLFASSGRPALGFLFNGVAKAAGQFPGNEAVFYGGGVDIGGVWFTQIGDSTTEWERYLVIMTQELIAGAYDLSPNYSGSAGPNEGQFVTATGAGRKYATFYTYYKGAGAIASMTNAIYWKDIAVAGRHELAVRGSFPAQGYYTSDMAKYVVKKWAPLLTVGGDIKATSFVIPHMSFKEPTTAQAMIESFVPFGGQGAQPLVWGVYDGRRFFMAEPGEFGRTWRVRHDQTAQSQNQGADASERINGVKVTYDDGTGKKLSVGPPGSYATTETSRMEDRSPSNPANFDNARHWRQYDAGIMNLAQAELVGGLVLAQAGTIRWRGSVNVQGWAEVDGGEVLPAALMRAGDYVIVEDDPAGDTRPRLVMNSQFGSDDGAAKLSVGAPPDYVDVLLARAGVTLASRGI